MEEISVEEIRINEYGIKHSKNNWLTNHRLFKSKEVVSVYVDDRSEHWVLNRKFLCYKIPSLKGRMEGFGSEDGEILLKHVEPHVFAMAIDWFLTGDLKCPKQNHRIIRNVSKDHFALWCALHNFANQFEIPLLSVAAIERIRQCLAHAQWQPTSTEIRYVFKETQDISELRGIVVRQVTRSFVGQFMNYFKKSSDEWAELMTCQPEFHSRILRAIKGQCSSGIHQASKNGRGLQPQRQNHFIRRPARAMQRDFVVLTGGD